MNNITNVQETITSMEVAKMVETTHRNVMRKLDGRLDSKKPVKGYVQILTEAQMGVSEFFVPSTYIDSSGKENKCYLITKKGCEFLAHKFTGEKGVIFTARYINRFHEMEEKLKSDKLYTAKCEISSELPRKNVNSYVLPPANKWYHKNKETLHYICKKLDIPMKEMYHGVLWYLGEEYDLDAANEIYYKRTGIHPKYPINIVSFFPELETLADEFLELVMKKIG